MFLAMLRMHGRSMRWALALLSAVLFLLPWTALQSARRMMWDHPASAETIITLFASWSPIFPVAAALIGSGVALAVWYADHRADHVYSLILPVSRARYALLKLGTGMVLVAAPSAALMIGALCALWLTDLPAAVHGYPVSFGVRFLLAALVVHSAVSAAAAGRIRTIAYLTSALVLLLLVGGFLNSTEAAWAVSMDAPRFTDLFLWILADWPGPFHLLGGNWMLIDV